jgi:hypothetical protein
MLLIVERSLIIQLMQSMIIIKLIRVIINKTGYFVSTWYLRIMIGMASNSLYQYIMKTFKINIILLLLHF